MVGVRVGVKQCNRDGFDVGLANLPASIVGLLSTFSTWITVVSAGLTLTVLIRKGTFTPPTSR